MNKKPTFLGTLFPSLFDRLPEGEVRVGEVIPDEKLKVVTFHLVGGQTVTFDDVVDANFSYDEDTGALIKWSLRFRDEEPMDHKEYPVFFHMNHVSAISQKQYNKVRLK